MFNRQSNIVKQITLNDPKNTVQQDLHALQQAVIPDNYRDIIAKAHNPTKSHFGIERTVTRIRYKLKQDWKEIREHVRLFIKQCPHCKKMSYLKDPIHSIPFTTAAYVPMERIRLDH